MREALLGKRRLGEVGGGGALHQGERRCVRPHLIETRGVLANHLDRARDLSRQRVAPGRVVPDDLVALLEDVVRGHHGCGLAVDEELPPLAGCGVIAKRSAVLGEGVEVGVVGDAVGVKNLLSEIRRGGARLDGKRGFWRPADTGPGSVGANDRAASGNLLRRVLARGARHRERGRDVLVHKACQLGLELVAHRGVVLVELVVGLEALVSKTRDYGNPCVVGGLGVGEKLVGDHVRAA